MIACRHSFTLDVEHPDYERCLQCDTRHSLIAPDPLDVYTADYWSEARGHSSLDDQVFNCETHRENGTSKNDYILSLIDTPGRVAALDIGCAPGALLRRLKRDVGFAVVDGVEVCHAWAADIQRIAGGRVYLWHGTFPQVGARLSLHWYDLVTAIDVFEHSHEPEAFLEECCKILKPGGQLILMMPLAHDGDPMPDRMFEPQQHVYLHTPKNIARMFGDAGFEGVRIDCWTRGHEVVTAHKPLPLPREIEVNYDEDGEGICLP